MRISDWSSDVCSSDLRIAVALGQLAAGKHHGARGEVDGVVALDHEDFQAGRAIADHQHGAGRQQPAGFRIAHRGVSPDLWFYVAPVLELGGASWRESVCQYV